MSHTANFSMNDTTCHDEQAELLVLLRDATAAYCAQTNHFERLRSASAEQAALDQGVWQGLATQGWLSLRWSEALGGTGLGLEAACAVAQMLGRYAVPEPFAAQAILPAALADALINEGNAALWQRIANGYTDASNTVAAAWQKPPKNDRPMQVQAHTSHYVLDGSVGGIIGAPLAAQLLVVASHNGQSALFLLDKEAVAAGLQTHGCSDGSTLSTLTLQQWEIAAERLIAQGDAVDAAIAQAEAETCLVTAAQLLGHGEAALECTLAYLRTRQQFGHLIGSFQALQHASVDVFMALKLAHASLQAALSLTHTAAAHSSSPTAPSAQQLAAISAAKARAGDAAIQAGRFGVQAHGAMGFTAEADIGWHLKAALRLNAWLGNARQHRARYVQLMGLGAIHQGQP